MATESDDLDRPPTDCPGDDHGDRVELIDGTVVFDPPQNRFHERMTRGLANSLNAQAPEHLVAVARMDVRLGHRTRPCPDVLLVETATDHDGRTCYDVDEVQLVVEIVSPESEHRDRELKPARYAEAGIAHFWRVEENNGRPVVYAYELDPATRAYAVTGIHRGRLEISVPFPIVIDLDGLPR